MDNKDVTILYSNGAHPARSDELLISISHDFNRRQLPDKHELSISDIWEERCTINPTIWNGTKFRLHSVSSVHNGRVQWNLGLTCYKHFLGTNFSQDAALYQTMGRNLYDNPQAFMSDPLGVGGLLLTADNQVVLLKRSSNCAESPLLYDIPGGHPEPSEIIGPTDIDKDISRFTEEAVRTEIFSSILREIRDEVNIPLSTLSAPLLLGVALNRSGHCRPSSEFLIRTTLCGVEVVDLYNKGSQAEADESTHIKLLAHDVVMKIKQAELWQNLAPSAKGCFLLYHDYVNQDSVQ